MLLHRGLLVTISTGRLGNSNIDNPNKISASQAGEELPDYIINLYNIVGINNIHRHSCLPLTIVMSVAMNVASEYCL